MIVICPSCRTRYRHRPGEETAAERGRCSRCETVFPLIPALPSYRLVKPRGVARQQTALAGPSPEAALRLASGQSMSIGMDDPTLAPRLGQTGPDGGGAVDARLASGVAADGDRPAEAPAVPKPGRTRPTGGPAEADAPLWVVGKVLFAITCVGLGGAGGYFVSSELGVDSTLATIAGITVGLLLSWGWLRWLPLKS